MLDQPPARTPQTAGVLVLLLCAALWSLNGPLIKLLDGTPGITIACYRSLIGGIFFVPFALRRIGSLGRVPPAWPIASVLVFTLMTACFVIATTLTAAASAIVLQYAAPLVVFLLSPWLLKETPRWSEGLVLLGAMAGVAAMFALSSPADTRPLLIALASGLGYGSLIVVLRGMRDVDPTVVTALNFFGSGLVLLPLVGAFDGRYAIEPRPLAIIAVMSIVQFALPYVLFSWAIRRVEAHKASLIVLLEPILNPVFTWLAVGEPVPRATRIGGPLILLSVFAWMLLSMRNRRAAHRP